jgi:hypothetical protein
VSATIYPSSPAVLRINMQYRMSQKKAAGQSGYFQINIITTQVVFAV